MYIIGNYAIAPILTVNPNLNLGMFSLPASNNEEENKLVSGIDVYFAIPKDCKNYSKEQIWKVLPLIKQVSFFNLDNKAGMIILYVVFGISMNTLLYVGYLKNIPLELEEAEYVDGTKQWTVFWKIVFPLLKPMYATVGIMISTLITMNK